MTELLPLGNLGSKTSSISFLIKVLRKKVRFIAASTYPDIYHTLYLGVLLVGFGSMMLPCNVSRHIFFLQVLNQESYNILYV